MTPAIDQALTGQVFKNSLEKYKKNSRKSDPNNKLGIDETESTAKDKEQYSVDKKEEINVVSNHFENLFSKMKTVPNPKFIKSYAELFVQSRIMEKIIPRDVTQPEGLEAFNPYLIRDTVTEKLVPEGTSPYVGSDLTGVNRGVT